MHLVVLSHWYHPEPVGKPHGLASELASRGYRVSVVTGYPNYPTGRLYDGYKVRPWTRERIDGVDVYRVPSLIDRSRSGVRRILSYTSYSAVAAVLGALRLERPDVLWTYQIGLPGVVMGWLRRVPLVHEVQDLWPDWGAGGNMGIQKVSLLYRMLDRQERTIYGRATRIATISEGFRRLLIGRGVPDSKIQVLPNWANDEHFHVAEADPELAGREGLAGRFNVIYGGNLGVAQDLGVALGAADQLRDLPDVQFVIIGDGVERARLEQEAAERGLRNVRFLGSRPPDQMSPYLALADALLIHLLPRPEYEITIPSKTYAYLASGRPILAGVAGDTAALIDELGAGLVCPPGDPAALAAAVRALHAMPAADREAMGRAGRAAFEKRFSRKVVVTEYDRLFQDLVRARRRSGGPAPAPAPTMAAEGTDGAPR